VTSPEVRVAAPHAGDPVRIGPSFAGRIAQRAIRLPTSLWLGVFVVLSAAIRYAQLNGRMPAPWIFPDELIYSELGKSFGTSGHFAIRDVPFHELSFGITYPVLIAPAYALADTLPHAYALARAINCAVMALAAVPVYLLGRRLLAPGAALLAAVLAVEIPSMAYSATLMSENLFYPAFLLTVLAIVRVAERPTGARQLVALGAIAFAVLTRLEAVAFVPAYLSALGLLNWIETPGRGVARWAAPLRAYRLTGFVLGGAATAALLFQLARGKALSGLLGAYDSVVGRYSLADVPRWFVYHLADLDLYVGVAPFAAMIVIAANVLRRRESSRERRIFVAVTLAVIFWFTLLVAAYATQPPTIRVYERYLFHVVPLLLIALLVWVNAGLARSSRLAVGAALVAGVLPALLPFGEVVNRNIQASTPGLLPWGGLSKTLVAPSYAWAVALGLGGLVAVLFLRDRQRQLLVWTAVVLLNFGVIGFFVGARYRAISTGAAEWGAADQRDWIDRAVGSDATVAAVWPGRFGRGLEGRYAIWQNEIFNRSIGPVYDLREPLKRYVPETRVRVDPATGVLHDLTGTPIAARYALSDVTFPLVGRAIIRDQRTGIVLYDVGGVIRAARVPSRT
jgi:Dolichyl-phosphate-mannose-protein mannosyltransferase